jgi:hypothetical protein
MAAKKKMCEVSDLTHEFVSGEINRRVAAGEIPKPTFKSVLQELVLKAKKQSKK